MDKKERLDKLILNRGLFDSREKARAYIMSGSIYVDGMRVDKPGQLVSTGSMIELRAMPSAFVSRGGLKLEKALNSFGIDVSDRVAIDIGASTGGFTDCLLKKGAKKVYAVDVGYGQLAWELRNSSKVVCMERTNARYLKPGQFSDIIDIIAVDVSFISLKLIIPPAKEILKPEGDIICLIKPQFEAGRDKVGKKGVVKDPAVHEEVISDITKFTLEIGLNVCGIDYSPIKGPEGNIEYLIHIKKLSPVLKVDDFKGKIKEVVMESHNL